VDRESDEGIMQQQLFKYAESLSTAVIELKEKNRELQEAYLDTIQRLVHAAEYRDEDTSDHIVRISRYSIFVAGRLGLSEDDMHDIYYASPMHDIGKIGIPDSILLKPSRLSEKEFGIMKTHSEIGASILDNSRARVLQVACRIAISHHEKWNGTGYPNGLSGNDIPVEGRIVGLVDVFDALTSKRPYKNPYPVEIACDIIERERLQHFDPDAVDVFLDNMDEILKIRVDVGSAAITSRPEFAWSERDENPYTD
jgi:putative two-component system response regulator